MHPHTSHEMGQSEVHGSPLGEEEEEGEEGDGQEEEGWRRMRWRMRGEVVVGGEEAVQWCATGCHVECDEEDSGERDQRHRSKFHYNNMMVH